MNSKVFTTLFFLLNNKGYPLFHHKYNGFGLDINGKDGYSIEEMNSNFPSTTFYGVDNDRKKISRLQKEYPSYNFLYKNIENGDIRNLYKKFQVVKISEYNNLEKMLQNTNKLLKEDGVCILRYKEKWLKMSFKKFWFTKDGKGMADYNYLVSIRFITHISNKSIRVFITLTKKKAKEENHSERFLFNFLVNHTTLFLSSNDTGGKLPGVVADLTNTQQQGIHKVPKQHLLHSGEVELEKKKRQNITEHNLHEGSKQTSDLQSNREFVNGRSDTTSKLHTKNNTSTTQSLPRIKSNNLMSTLIHDITNNSSFFTLKFFDDVSMLTFALGRFYEEWNEKDHLDDGVGIICGRNYHMNILKNQNNPPSGRSSASTTVDKNSFSIKYQSYDESMFKSYDFEGEWTYSEILFELNNSNVHTIFNYMNGEIVWSNGDKCKIGKLIDKTVKNEQIIKYRCLIDGIFYFRSNFKFIGTCVEINGKTLYELKELFKKKYEAFKTEFGENFSEHNFKRNNPLYILDGLFVHENFNRINELRVKKLNITLNPIMYYSEIFLKILNNYLKGNRNGIEDINLRDKDKHLTKILLLTIQGFQKIIN